MLDNYSNIRLSDTFINLTDETIHLYEVTSGKIWDFLPQPQEIPASPNIAEDGPIVHYIVKPEFVPVLAAFRPLDDIATISHKYHGRNGITITYLSWAKEPKTFVRLYENAHSVNFAHK